MGRRALDPNFDLRIPTVTKSVNALHDAAAAKDIWTPATGKRVYVTGYHLQVMVNVALQNAAAGDYVLVYDSVVTAPIAVLGIVQDGTPVAGSVLSASAQTGVGAFAQAVTEMGSNIMAPPVQTFYRSSAKNNVIKVALLVAATGAVVDVGTGELRILGTIWGHEENY